MGIEIIAKEAHISPISNSICLEINGRSSSFILDFICSFNPSLNQLWTNDGSMYSIKSYKHFCEKQKCECQSSFWEYIVKNANYTPRIKNVNVCGSNFFFTKIFGEITKEYGKQETKELTYIRSFDDIKKYNPITHI